MTGDGDQRERARAVVTGWGLRHEPLAPVVLDDPAAGALLPWARNERLDGALVAAVAAGAIALPDAAADQARAQHLEAQHRALACEAMALGAVDALERAGIAPWILKGPAAAHLDYPDPALRSFVDVDLLVARRHLLGAVRALEEDGFVRSEPDSARWWERRFARTIVLRSPEGIELDLHAAIAETYFGVRLDHGTLLALGHDPVDLGGREVRALTAPARLLASAYAATLSRGPQLRLLRDVGHLLAVTEVDWEAAVALARPADGEAVLAAAIERAAAETGLDPQHPAVTWARAVVPPPHVAEALALVETVPSTGWTAAARSILPALGPVDRALFLTGVTAHALRHRGQRNRSLVQQLRRGSRLLGRTP
ncbi:MAG: nucleotidyltransferase family protein [Acidimicrobiales bacterium]